MEDSVDGINQLALELADKVEEANSTAVIIHCIGDEMSAFAHDAQGNLSAIIACALDRNPELIPVFVNALSICRKHGENQGHESFGQVIFHWEGIKH